MAIRYHHKNVDALQMDLTEANKFLLDQSGEIDKEWPDLKKKNDGRFQEILKDVRRTTNPRFRKYSITQVNEFLRTGYGEGLKELIKMKKDLTLPDNYLSDVASKRTRRKNNLNGNIRFSRLVEGQTSNLFLKRENQQKNSGSVVTLIGDMGANCTVSHEQLKWSGAALCSLIEALEKSGYRVEVVWSNTTRNSSSGFENHFYHVSFVVKKPDQTMRMATLAAVTMIPSMFRTYGFLGLTKCAVKNVQIPHTLGRHQKLTVNDFHIDNPVWRKNAIVLPSKIYSKEAAKRAVMQIYEKTVLNKTA